MNKINPLHIIALLAVVALFLFVQIKHAKEELLAENTAFKNSKQIALETRAYKGVYADKDRAKSELNRLVRPYLGHLTVEHNAHMTTISSKSLSRSQLDSLMSKVLNGAYKIQRLQINKIDKKNASLELEIKW